MDIAEIKEYWHRKYPSVHVNIWTTPDKDRYFGNMRNSTESVDLNASSIGELIGQGESFLRKLNKV